MIVVNRLRWDDWNIAHIVRHYVVPHEVDEVCHGHPLVAQSYKNRLLLTGPPLAGRMLAVVLDPEGQGTYCPITARPADRKERRIYQVWKEGSGS